MLHIPIDIDDLLQRCKATDSPTSRPLLLDVRSPSEFAKGHIPSAVSLPLFTDSQREQVGTIYKQVGRQEAIKVGLDIIGPIMRRIIEDVELLQRTHQPSQVVVHCWRGGMRSGSISWLLSLYGIENSVLLGGYKSYRTWVSNQWLQTYPFCVLGGYTGSGKTILLKELHKKHEQYIDLEKLACHKGSAFGQILMSGDDNLPCEQVTQEQFENTLAFELYQCSQTNRIWIEDESRRIGKVLLPLEIWMQMRTASTIFLDIPQSLRINQIFDEYSRLPEEYLLNGFTRIQRKLGGARTTMAKTAIENKDYHTAIKIALEYYDSYYKQGLLQRENATCTTLELPTKHSHSHIADKLIHWADSLSF